MKQVARNLTDPVDGFLRKAKYLIHDRDPLFTEAFADVLRARGVASVKIPASSPNCNPHAERLVKTIKYECLNLRLSPASDICATWSKSSWPTIWRSAVTKSSMVSSSRAKPNRPTTTGPAARFPIDLDSAAC